MRIGVVHNRVSDQGTPDEQDVLVQVRAVGRALNLLGHEWVQLGCDLNLAAAKESVCACRPDIVFNLVESLDRSDRLVHLFTSVLDVAGIPYTGSKTQTLFFTSNKILAKRLMAAADLPTPPWVGPYPPEAAQFPVSDDRGRRHASVETSASKWIVKSLWEHASMGLNECDPLLSTDRAEIPTLLAMRAPHLGGACFAEAYVEGREFNISLLAGPDGPRALAPAEILFDGYPPGKPRIVGYRAKWEQESFEYRHTVRSFRFPSSDSPLLRGLEEMAKLCWHRFGLQGYARVDFRVDEEGAPWILEVNANPCLSPDAGFAAALSESGLSFEETVRRILAAATTS